MKKLKQAVSYVLVFMIVFSSFTILPSEFFHSAFVSAADLLTGQSGAEETYTEGDFTYSLINDYTEVKIVKYNGKSTDVVIPDVVTGSEFATIAGKKVTAIGDSVFKNKGLTSVTFGKNIKTIGNSAFYNNTALTKVDLSACTSLTTIGDYAFYDNNALATLVLPDSLQVIGYQAFYSCDKLTTVETGNNLTSIGGYAFCDCNSLKTVNITGGNNAIIGYEAFYTCDGLESVIIGDGVKTIERYAFEDCYNLKKVEIGNTVTTIESNAFEYCRSLTELSLGSSVETIGGSAFYDCNSLANLTIPNSVKTIDGHAFYDCDALENITIPNSVKTIGNYAFANNRALKTVTIGSGCTSIPAYTFDGDLALESITVSEDNTVYSSVDGVLFNKDKTKILYYPKSRSGAYTIPNTVTEIGESAFRDCKGLTELVIGDGVQTISNGAFIGCTNLSKVTFGKNIKTIGNTAFENNTALTEINLSACTSLTTIGDYAFKNNDKVTTLSLPDSLQTIGYQGFYSCDKITALETGENITSIGGYAFCDCNSLKTVNITGGNNAIIGYEAFYTCDGLESVIIGDGVKTIQRYAFEDCYNLKKVEIGNTVTTIEYNAFEYCRSLTELSLGSSVETIGGSAFYDCNSLANLTIPNSVKTIDGHAFYDCDALENITISNSVKTIGQYAFANNRALKTVTIGSGCTSIHTYAFDGDVALESITVSEDNTAYSSVDGALLNKDKTKILYYPKSRSGAYTIPNTVTEIGEATFRDCKNLTEVVIGDGVQTISNGAFIGCANLSKVTFGKNIKTIGNTAFENNTALTEIDFSACTSLTTIGDYAFKNNDKVTTLTLPDSLKTIGYQGFYSCDKITTLEIGENITSIGGYAFCDCNSLKTVNITGGNNAIIGYEAFYTCDGLESVIIGDGVKTIQRYAFEDCYNLKKVEIGNTVTTIEYNAFEYCRSLTELSLGSSVETIGSSAFIDCNSLANLTIPNSVKTIDSHAFYECDALENITIPDNVKTIGNYAFANNRALKTVTIGSGCTSIHTYAFDADVALESITVSEDNTVYSSVDGVLFNKDKTKILYYPKSRSGAYTIPNTVTEIGEATFRDCKGLTEVVIGDGVQTISNGAFIGCTNLSKVTFGKNIKTIGNTAFENNTALTKIDLSACTSLTTIGDYAFKNNDTLTTLTLPDSLKTIGYQGFYSCDKLIALETGENITSIGGYAFYDCNSLKTVNITGGNNATIGNEAFYHCDSLENVDIGKGVKTLGDYSFEYCQKLTEVKIGEDVTSVSSTAFYRSNNLTTIQILGRELTTIDKSSFPNNEKCTIYCPENSNTYQKLVSLGYTNVKFFEENFYVRDLTVAQRSSASATINWNKPYGHNNIDHYVIYKNGKKLAETEETTYTATGLKAGQEYIFAVTAVNNENLESEKTEITVIPACSSVESITAPNSNKLGGLVKVKLTANMSDTLSSNGGKGVFMYAYDGSKEGEELEENTWLESTDWYYACDATLSSNANSYVAYWDLTDVPTGSYYLKFLFTDKDGGTSTCYEQVTVDRTHPQKIDELMVIPTETDMELAWQISRELSTKIYRVYRMTGDSGKYELITEIHNRDTINYTDKKVEKGVIYSYYVVGVDEYGQESLTYDVVTAGLIDDVIAPSFIKMTPANSSYIYGNMRFTVNSSDNVGVTKTELYYSYIFDGEEADWKLLSEYNGSTMSKAVDTTVMNNGIVYIKAKIYDAVGNFTYSPAYKYMCDNQGPEKVTGLKCIQKYGADLTLAWNDVSDKDIKYYKVERLQADGTYTEVQKSYSKLGANISGLTPETEYTFRVVGYDKFDNRGIESDPLKVKTTEDKQSPAVTGFYPNSNYYNGTISLQITAQDDYKVKSLRIETSYDNSSWEELVTLTADKLEKSHTFRYDLDTTKFDEGSLYVRAIVKDTYDNETEENKTTCYEYVVDRTPAKLPTEFTASSDENYVALQWSGIDGDSSFESYKIYRSETENGEYTLIKSGLKTVNTYDSNVELGRVYYYKIRTLDKAGNESELSKAIYCKVSEDEEAPVIYDISPANGSVIGSKNKDITVMATDNAKVYTLKIEYMVEGLFSSYTTLKEITGNSSSNCKTTVALPLNEIADKATVTVKATASDQAGNTAREVTATYTIDKTAPTVKNLSVTQGDDNNFTLNWQAEKDNDAICYYVYRKLDQKGDYKLYNTVTTTSGKTEYSFTDTNISNTCTAVQYKVEAYDMVGNNSSVESEVFTLEVDTSPVANLNYKNVVVAESEYIYDASASTDNGTITQYKFDFGNGDVIKSTDSQVTYAYPNAGKFVMTLTVTDDEGKTSSIQNVITVNVRELASQVTVMVVDDKNRPVADAPVYVDLGSEFGQKEYTDSSGKITFQIPIGTHIIASYKENYLPVKQQITVTSGQMYAQLVLVEEPIVTGTFEIHKMTFDEIVAAGIDINAAANRNVVRLHVTLVYCEKPINTTVYWNGTKTYYEPVIVTAPNGEKRKLTPTILGGGGSGGSGGSGGGSAALENPTLVYIDVPVEFSYLKDFFSVSLHIVNHASEEFSLLNNTVSLNVPNGLTVMDTDCSEPSPIVSIPEIKGQSQKTVKWILRGDKAGSYNISADFLGTLSYFNEPVRATFVADDPIEVEDATSVKVTVEAAEESYGGVVFYNVVVENTGQHDMYDFQWKNLIEPFGNEFVDADGNRALMEEQRNTLKSGEKFVYHYYQETGGNLEYLTSIIEDLNNCGAQVSVELHEVPYFLDFYFDMFPEETGSFVLYVKNSSGGAVPEAEVSIGTSEFTTDGAGRVIIEDRSMAGGDLIVSKEGYYDYVERNYCAFALSKSDTITLYQEGEFALESVKVDGVNVLEDNKNIYKSETGDDKKTVYFSVKAYGEITSMEIVQDGETVAKLTGKSSTGNYTMSTTVDKLKKDKALYIIVKATDETGNEFTIEEELLITVIFKPSLTPEDFPTIGDINVNIDEGDGSPIFSLLSGFNLTLKDSIRKNLSIVYDYTQEKYICKFGVGVDIGSVSASALAACADDFVTKSDKNGNIIASGTVDLTKPDGDDTNSNVDLSKPDTGDLDETKPDNTKPNKESNPKPERNHKETNDDYKKPNEKRPKAGIDLYGTIEIKVDDEGEYYVTKGSVTLQISVQSPELGKTFMLGYVPVAVGVTFGGSASTEIGFTYDIQADKFEAIIPGFSLGAQVRVTAGVGISGISAGVYGSLASNFNFAFDSSDILDSITISGEIGLYAEALAWSVDFPIASLNGFQIYPWNSKSKAKTLSQAMASAYSASSYSVNDKLMGYNAVWDNPILANSGTTNLLKDTYAYSAPQIITCGDDALMVYLGVDKTSKNTINAMTLYCSVYNKETGKWGVPTKIDTNNQLDMSYSLCTDGEKIYLVYSQANKVFDDNGTLEGMTASGDIYTAVFDTTTNKFTNFTQLTNNSTFDGSPIVKTINGVPTAVWVNNSNNNLFLTDSSNSIMMSTCENGVWSTPTVVSSKLNTVQNLSLVQTARGTAVVYTTDGDCDVTTLNDKTLYCYYSKTGTTVEIDNNLETAVAVEEIVNSPLAIWYKNGILKQCNLNTNVIDDIWYASEYIADGFKLVTDGNGSYAIVYVEDKNLACAMYLDTATLQWTDPVTVATSDNIIENLEAQYVNGNLTLVYHDTTAVSNEGNYEVTSNMVTTVVNSGSKVIVDDVNVEFNKVVPGETTTAKVTVINAGAMPSGNLTFNVTNYDGMNLGSFTTENVSLASGETDTYDVEFTVPQAIVNRDILITVTDSNKNYTGSCRINLAMCDYSISAKQTVRDGSDYIYVEFTNSMYYDSPAKIEVYNKVTDEVYYSVNTTGVTAGAKKGVLIPLETKYMDENRFVYVRIVPVADEYYDYDNSDMFQVYKEKQEYELSGITVNGTAIKDYAVDKTAYTVAVENIAKVEIVPQFINPTLTYKVTPEKNVYTINMFNNKGENVGTYTVTVTENQAQDYSIVGDMNLKLVKAQGSNNATAKKFLNSGTYKIKVDANGTQLGYNKTITDTCSNLSFKSSYSAYLILNATGGTYTFVFNTATNKLTIKHDTYSIVGDVNLQLKENTNGTATAETFLNSGTYKLKVNANGTEMGYNRTITDICSNLSFNANYSAYLILNATGGKYTFVFNKSTNKLTIKHDSYGITGDVNLQLIEKANGTATAETTLNSGSYKIKVALNGTEMGYNKTVTDVCYGVTFKPEFASYLTLNATGGKYIFTLDIATNKLTIKKTGIYIMGDMNFEIKNVSSERAMSEIKLQAGTYKIKVNNNGTQLGYNKTITDTCNGLSVKKDYQSYITFNATGGIYSFIFDKKVNKLVIKKVRELPNAYLIGDLDTVLNPVKGRNLAMGTAYLDAGDYNFKLSIGGVEFGYNKIVTDSTTGSMSFNSKYTSQVTLKATGGMYTFVLNTLTNKLDIRHTSDEAQSKDDVHISGDFNLVLNDKAENGNNLTTATGTVKLNEGTYTFKVHNHGTVYTAGVVVNDVAMKKLSNKYTTPVTLNATGGTYKFEFDKETGALTVSMVG